MLNAFVGFHDRRRPPRDDDRRRVAAALGGDATAVVLDDLVVASTVPPATGRSAVWLDGTLHSGPVDDVLGDGDLRAVRGEFAVLIYDRAARRGLLARDHVGSRGVHWHERDGRLVFATEARYVLALLDHRPPPDIAAVAHLLGLSATPMERSFHEGVHRLPAAHVLRFGSDGRSIKRYWAPEFRPPVERSRDEHVAGLRDVVGRAVERRCGDGVSAVLLSGGLDSSTVAGFSSLLPDDRRPRRAYSATFPDHPTIDETQLVDVLCDRFGLAATRAVVRSGSIIAGAAEYIDRWLVPPPSPNLFFWLPLLRRAAADGVEVMLDGEGGDEIFGLSPYLIADRLRAGRLRAAVGLVRSIPGGGPHLSRAQMRPFLREYGLKGAAPYWVHRLVRRRHRAGAPPWLRPATVAALVESDLDGRWKLLPGPRWWAYVVDAVTQGRGASSTHDHVRRRAAMCGIEPRHPLVDPDVVTFVLTIPPEAHFDARHSRPLIRDAVAGIVPDEVRLRPGKSTFDAMFHEAMAGPDFDVARRLLRPGEALVGEFADLDLVNRELLATPPPPGHRLWWAQHVWRLVTVECALRAAAGTPVGPLVGPAADDGVRVVA